MASSWAESKLSAAQLRPCQRTRPRPSASKAAIASAWLAEATIEAHQADQQAHQGLLGQKN